MGNFYANVTLKMPASSDVLGFLQQSSRTAYVAQPSPEFAVVFDSATESQDDKLLTKLAAELSRKFDCAALAVLNHDDDILCYWLFKSGKDLDRYDSRPGYFKGKDLPPSGGDAEVLINAFEAKADSAKVNEILHFHKSSQGAGDAEAAQKVLEKKIDELNVEVTRCFNEFMKDRSKLAEFQEAQQKMMNMIAGEADTNLVEPRYLFAVQRHSDLVKELGLPDCAVGAGYNYIEEGGVPWDHGDVPMHT